MGRAENVRVVQGPTISWQLTALAEREEGLLVEAAGAGAVEGLLAAGKELDRGLREDGLREVVCWQERLRQRPRRNTHGWGNRCRGVHSQIVLCLASIARSTFSSEQQHVLHPDAVVQASGAVEPVGFGAHSKRLFAATIDRQSRQQPSPKPTVAALTRSRPGRRRRPPALPARV